MQASSLTSSGKQHRGKHEDKKDRHHKESRHRESDKSAGSKATKPDKQGSGTSTSASADNVEFLFVIINLVVSESVQGYKKNKRGDVVPFACADEYDTTQERAGHVYRYNNGEVTDVNDEYVWYRPEVGKEGCIWHCHTGFEHPMPMAIYKTYSVFRCWRFNPITWMGSDISVHDVRSEGHPAYRLYSLQFSGRNGLTGVTEIEIEGNRHVSGRNPSWMPSIVPRQFSNPYPHAPRSQGLRGELPVILGMMALSQAQHFDPTTQWRRGHWVGAAPNDEDLNPGPENLPRGVLVQICYDPARGAEAHAAISAFEWNGIVVKEESRRG